jgi:hypothetical protein
MRKTKFRAWDKQRKQMLFDGDYWSGENRQKDNSSICYPILVTNHGVQWCKKYPHPMPEDAIEFDRMTMEDLELMERTGFKTADGKDIYEEDIVRIGTEYNNLSQKNGKPVYETVRMIHGRWEPLCFFKDGLFNVYGNSFQNAELLEATS